MFIWIFGEFKLVPMGSLNFSRSMINRDRNLTLSILSIVAAFVVRDTFKFNDVGDSDSFFPDDGIIVIDLVP